MKLEKTCIIAGNAAAIDQDKSPQVIESFHIPWAIISRYKRKERETNNSGY